MDEVVTTDIQGFALPGSGTIKLSEIKSEFNKGNNLKAYYGAASGIPSSGTIKVTDFYGKSASTGSAPQGSYSGLDYLKSAPYINAGTSIHVWYQSGSGDGTYYPMTNKAGVVTLTSAGADPTDLEYQTYWPAFLGLSGSSALDYWQQYRQLRVETPGLAKTYSGTWSEHSYAWQGSGAPPSSYFEFSNTEAGKQIATAVSRGDSWFVSLAGPTSELEYQPETTEE